LADRGETEGAEQPLDAIVRLGAHCLQPLHRLRRAGLDVGPHRQLSRQSLTDIDRPDRASQLAQVDPAEPATEHVDGPARRKPLRSRQPEQGRLPGTVRAEQRPVLTRLDRQRDVVQDVGTAGKPHIDAADVENAHAMAG
jgi:hypothetical protein